MPQFSIPLCASCKHFNVDDWTCAAFTDGIPSEIIQNIFDHRREHPSDGGIQYSAKDGQEDAAAEWEAAQKELEADA